MSIVVPEPILRWSEHAVRALVCVVVSMATWGLALGFFGIYRWWSLLPVVAVSALALLRLWIGWVPHLVDPADKGWAWIAGTVGVIACTVFHARYSGNFLFITRDSAFYNLVGLDLARTGDLTFPGLSDQLARIPGITGHSQGQVEQDGVVYTQGFHGTEAVLAPTMWIGGTWLYLKSTALLGGLCLLVLRRVAVRLTSPWPATAVTLALGLSIPYIEFTRNPYSEILGLLCVVGGLLVLLERPFSPATALVATFVSGTAMTGRIDALLVIAGAVFAVSLVPLVVERRWPRRLELGAIAVGTAVPVGLGLIIGYERSPGYTSDLSRQMRTQALVVVAVMLAIGAVYAVRAIGRRWPVLVAWISARSTAQVVSAVFLGAGLAYWLIVPQVMERHGRRPNSLTEGLQAREGVDIEPLRNYGEQAFPRLAMNYGSITVALAIFGAALAVYAVLRHRHRMLWIVLATALPSLPYLVEPRITADMPWAMRRFLPVIIPVTLLLAAVALDWIRPRLAEVRMGWVAMLALVVVPPVAAAYPVADIRGEADALGFTEAVCREIPPDAGVFVTHSSLRLTGIQTFEHFCEVEAATVTRYFADDIGTLALEVATVWDAAGRPIVLLVSEGGAIPDGLNESSRRTITAKREFVERTLSRLPTGAETGRYTVDVVQVTVEG